MIGKVHNGARVPVRFPFFEGVAGVREVGGSYQMAVTARLPMLPQIGSVDGSPARVIAAVKSELVPGMILATVEIDAA